MTFVLGTRVALFLLLIQNVCFMRGYSRSTRLGQIYRSTDSHVKRTEAKQQLPKLRLCLSNMSVESLKEFLNSQLLASQALTNQLSFQDLPKEIAPNKSANVSRISSSTLRSIIRKKRSALFQRDKALAVTAINETLADLIAKVLRVYSSLSVYLPRMSDQTELNDTNFLSEVMALKNDSKNIVARKSFKATRVAAQTTYRVIKGLVLKTKPERTPDVTLPFDEKRTLSAVLTDLRRVLQWTLNLSDIILTNLTGGETKNSDSDVQTTAGKNEKTINAIIINVSAQVFVDHLPKVTEAFKTVVENAEYHETNETNVSSVTLDSSHRSTWKKKRKYDESSRHKRLVAPHTWKDSLYKRRSKDIYKQLPKVSIPECEQRAVATPDEYGVYHIQKGLMMSKLDPRDLENPLEFPVEGLENVPRYKNMDVALEFSFKHPLLVSGIGFKRLPNDRRDIVQLASIYVERQKERNSWSPLLDEDTNDIMLFKVTSKNLHSLSPLHDAWSGIRVYPQKWSSSKPFIGRPIFIYCAFIP